MNKDASLIASKMLEVRKLEKLLSTYYEGVKPLIYNFDSCVHPTFSHCGYGHEYSETGAGGTECLPLGELVLTNRGYIPVEQVLIGDYVIGHSGKPRKVIDKIDNGVQPLITTITENLLSLRTTHNHEFLLSSGEWKRADRLSIDDEIVVYADKEEFRPIKDWEVFYVSSWGRIVNGTTGTIIKQRIKNKWGHLKVTLYRNGAQTRNGDKKDFSVGRLVAQAFCPNTDNKPEVRHINGIAWDNHYTNLEWGTAKENRLDACEHGSLQSAQDKKYSDETIEIIKNSKVGSKTLGKQSSISDRYIRMVRAGTRRRAYENKEKKLNFYTSKVIFRSPHEPEQTIGLTVEEDHSHLTGGMMTHNTGRLSCTKPNIQNIPRDGKIKDHFVSRFGSEGRIVCCDFSQIEVIAFAYLTRDIQLINDIEEGRDIHCALGSDLYGEEITKNDPRRQGIKPCTFLVIYGGGYKKLAREQKLDEQFAKGFIETFYRRYPQTKEWQNRQVKKVEESARYIDEYTKKGFQKQEGFLQNVTGRKLYFQTTDAPEFLVDKGINTGFNPSEIKNYPIQSLATADIALMLHGQLWREMIKYRNLQCDHPDNKIIKPTQYCLQCNNTGIYDKVLLVNQVHDDIVADVREDFVKEYCKITKNVLTSIQEPFKKYFKTDFDLPVSVEFKAGRSWGTCEKYGVSDE